jgi:DNA invertase Pin-like site-specific DNA recombinase
MPERAALFLGARLPTPGKKSRTQPDPQGELAQQERRCREYAAATGYQVAAVFREVLPELPESRPELKRLRTAMWHKEFDVVVAASPDRLYVDPDRVARFLWEARVLGLRVEFLEVPDPYVWVVKEYGWPH